MANFLKLLICSGLFISSIYGFPDSRNPNAEYELINPKDPEPPKPVIVPITTQRTHFINTPPPPPLDSKTFVYDPVSNTWTKVKETDPQPQDGTLQWNQSNDKWLTMIPRY
ncbi:uncharacterized protein LOC135954541 [Calliphora vicina]|uniref:uncharacterized protein LOC135954541 n=1 Tax=Calliphora vicina TaxID=7373 RepID=UPI00325BED7C